MGLAIRSSSSIAPEAYRGCHDAFWSVDGKLNGLFLHRTFTYHYLLKLVEKRNVLAMLLSRSASCFKGRILSKIFPANRRRDIDGMRGLAVLFVIFFHAGWLKGGFIGVDIFIVISGYFMGRSAFILYPFNAERFILHRLYRLLPALLGMIFIVSVAMLWWLLPSDRADVAENGAYALIYLSNYWASHHVGYFEGQSIAYPFLHTWSLSLEMQFYVVICLISWFVNKIEIRKIVLYVIFLLSLFCSIFEMYLGNHSAYYNLSVRLCEFSLGTMIWFMPKVPHSRIFSIIYYIISFSLIVLFGFFCDLKFASPSLMVLLPCFAVMFMILQKNSPVQHCLELISPVGVVSYSLYLWHWPAIVFASYFSPVHGMKMVLVLGAGLFAGCLSYILIEEPLLAYEKKASSAAIRRGGFIMLGLCGILATGLAWISFISASH